MDTEIKKWKKITRFMQKQGILCLKTPEIEIQLAPRALLHETIEVLPEEKEISKEPESQYTENDQLFWSSPGAF